jgi:hypothetical protein
MIHPTDTAPLRDSSETLSASPASAATEATKSVSARRRRQASVAVCSGCGPVAGGPHQSAAAPECQSAQCRGEGGALGRVTRRGNARRHVHCCQHERSNRLHDGLRIFRRLHHHGGSGMRGGGGGVCAGSTQQPNPWVIIRGKQITYGRREVLRQSREPRPAASGSTGLVGVLTHPAGCLPRGAPPTAVRQLHS